MASGGLSRRAAALLLPVLAIGLPGLASAQGVQYTTVTQISLPGALGSIARFAAKMGGGSTKSADTTYVTPTKRRTDNARESEIIDVDADQIIHVDHAKKQYYVMTFEQAEKAMEAAAEQVSSGMSQAKQEPSQGEGSGSSTPQIQTQMSFDLKPTGHHEKILGHDAAESYLTEGLDVQATEQDEQTKQDSTTEGNLTLFEDLWTTKDMPAVAKVEHEFEHNLSAKWGSTVSSTDLASLGKVMGDPRVSAALKKASENGTELQDTPLRTVLYLVTVPEGQKFDPELALSEGKPAQKKKSGGFGGFLKAAMSKATDQGRQQDQQAQQTPPHQTTFMKSTSEVTRFKVGSIPASVFQPPAGYTEVQPPDLTGGS
ncbi:MAG: hypothetical protein LJF06_07800 [Gemmatimonadetes bacterium]|nr:hypothetical protein [Gemmatimonadota bacterium]